MQPDYFDTGNYDIRVEGCKDYAITGGPWIPIATKTGWANPLGGAFSVDIPITIPNDIRYSYTIRAKDSSEPNDPNPDLYRSTTFPIITNGVATVSPLSGQAPLTVTGTYSGGSNISDVEWNFSDGAPARGRNVTHTYTRGGGYDVRATPIGICGDKGLSTYAGYINVTDLNCHNPEGTNGSYICSGTTRLRCNNGAWVTVEQNSPQCGGTPPPPPPQNCSNPYGTPGSYACQGTTRVRCDNGSWTPVEYNSSQCGSTPPPVRCANPGGDEGDTICLFETLMECRNGSWQIKEENSPTCGYTPPPLPPTPPSGGCTNPLGVVGDTFCDGTTLKRCDGTAWRVVEYNSDRCMPGEPGTAGVNKTLIYAGIGLVAVLGIGYLLKTRGNI